MKIKKPTIAELENFINLTNGMLLRKDCLERMYCPKDIINELLFLREHEKSVINKFSNYIIDDDIRYFYPDVIMPTDEYIQEISKAFNKELECLQSKYYEVETMITLSLLEKINTLVKQREQLKSTINKFNNRLSVRLCEKNNTTSSYFEAGAEMHRYWKLIKDELDNCNKLVVEKLSSELKNIEDELKKYINLDIL